MAFGITEAGFQRKRLADIKGEMEDVIRSIFGNETNLLPESVFGQLVGVFSEREDLVWQAIEDVYNSQYPDTAFGASLDNVAAITGATRLGAAASTAVVRLFGTAGTLVPAGTLFSVDGIPDNQFSTNAAVTLVTGQDAVQSIVFGTVPTSGTYQLQWRGNNTSVLAYNANATAIQNALNALPLGGGIVVTGNYSIGFTVTFSGFTGKQVQTLISVFDNSLSDGSGPPTITIATTTPGVNQGEVACTATATGPKVAPAGTLITIVTPITGLSSVLNVDDAAVGRDIETDAQFRLRRVKILQLAGAGTIEAIRSAILSLDGVTECIVFENHTEVTDSSGRPPKSIEVVVQGGVDQTILDKLWQVKPAGIRTVGTVSGTVTDSQGVTQTLNFSRPTEIPIYVTATLTTNSKFPATGQAGAKQALVDVGNAFGIGNDVVVSPTLICALDEIPGIIGVQIFVGTAPSPTLPNNIPISINQISVFALVRTIVNIV